MRAFIAIDIPEEAKKEIIKIQKNLPAFEGKLTEEENLHLTLKFLGDVDEKTIVQIRERLRKIRLKSFETKISDLGFFSPQYVKIIWVKLDGCEKIQRMVDDGLSGLFEKENRFMSHLTIARVKNVKDKKHFIADLKKIKFTHVRFNVKSFELRKSNLTRNGPVYETIEQYDLS